MMDFCVNIDLIEIIYILLSLHLKKKLCCLTQFFLYLVELLSINTIFLC